MLINRNNLHNYFTDFRRRFSRLEDEQIYVKARRKMGRDEKIYG